MAEFLKVNGQEYPAKFISKYQDLNWDKRETQTIYLTMSHDEAAALLPDNTPWLHERCASGKTVRLEIL